MAARLTFKISDEVRGVLARSTITATTVTLPEQLDRKLYEAVNKALEGAGGKWNRSKKLHVFDRDPREALGLAVETGKATNVRTKLQAFYTPDALADRVVAAIGIATHPDVLKARSGEPASRPVVLEPSIGQGALACAVIRATSGHVYITGMDIDEVACRAAAAHMKLAVPPSKSDVTVYDGPPRWNGDGYTVYLGDFLKASVRDSHDYDYIVMNPPFAGAADMKHVTHAWKFLAAGGTLAAIMWPAWQTADTKAAEAFRALYDSAGGTVEDIEPGTFEHTDMPTVLVVMRKPVPVEDEDDS